MKRSGRKHRPHFGLRNKKKLLVEGFALLHYMAQGWVDREEAERNLGIPYREWYRWLEVFRDLKIPLAFDYTRRHKNGLRSPRVRLWKADWNRLI